MAELAGELFDPFGQYGRAGGARRAIALAAPTPEPEIVENSDWRGLLGRAIETEILPRLLLAHRGADPRESQGVALENERDLTEFVELLISARGEGARESVERSARGRSPERVLRDMLAPAARRLGRLWEEDLCDFIDVTVGLRRLHDAIRDLIPDFDGSHNQGEPAGRALFLGAPGEKHVFGLTLVDSFFRRAGWRTRLIKTEEYLGDLRDEWFDIVGFSLSCERHVAALTNAVGKARAVSLNPSILVLVGGQIFAETPELCAQVGADATASDAPDAVKLAHALLERRARF